jgi:hypothetical protein
MKNCLKRSSTKHEIRSAVIAAALGVGILSWTVFGEEPSPSSGDYKTGGRERVYESSGSKSSGGDYRTGGREHYQADHYRYRYEGSAPGSARPSAGYSIRSDKSVSSGQTAAKSSGAHNASKKKEATTETSSLPSASPKSAKSDESKDESHSSDQKKETPHVTPISTPRASASPK